jgi:hypothetical protein
MEGSLGVHSDGPGKGATFTLELPFRPETGAQDSALRLKVSNDS